ncbi:MAG: Formylglycine-generating enzyme, required for sulfatase activity, contains SUMF1/FGE domain [uncultured Thiotrichaceae bacterium]|uniref:Formylglycine-generating enzyme, required for sulfatase activity, contains SUMF1/FGE domain n=1 Tax=uncultured Thiotrichaceae bacterium TaxID=298394 RepID=A0A6S6RUK8_9GAMM|nr:MAG: Formylglycine-generating enzyme, required for sulfatase activity, contains SUMF1/FGE domain [uncultured Thiotrichaceae bacterium]
MQQMTLWKKIWPLLAGLTLGIATGISLKMLQLNWQWALVLAVILGMLAWWKANHIKLALLGDAIALKKKPFKTLLNPRQWLELTKRYKYRIAAAITIALISGNAALWANKNNLPLSYALYQPLFFFGYAKLPEMVVIPPGNFRMGCLQGDDNCSSRELPVREVNIAQAFQMSSHEVTFLEYDSFVYAIKSQQKTNVIEEKKNTLAALNKSLQTGLIASGIDTETSLKEAIASKEKELDILQRQIVYPDDKGWGRYDRPAINVSWEDAQAYVWWLSQKTGQQCRLPSEAEWEYAARAGTETAYHWGDTASHEFANYGKDECCDGLVEGKDQWLNTAPVGQFKANAFGLHDMSGNVFEWVQDCYHDNYQQAPNDGSAQEVRCDEDRIRVLRGGSWLHGPVFLRSAGRVRNYPVFRINDVGFRLVCSLPSTEHWFAEH